MNATTNALLEQWQPLKYVTAAGECFIIKKGRNGQNVRGGKKGDIQHQLTYFASTLGPFRA